MIVCSSMIGFSSMSSAGCNKKLFFVVMRRLCGLFSRIVVVVCVQSSGDDGDRKGQEGKQAMLCIAS